MDGQWDTFHEVLPGYAEALGERALDFLWQKVAEEEAADSGVRRRPRDKPRRVDIVSIFLRDGDAVAMWDAFISEATCSSVACSSKRNGRPGRPLILRICCQRFWKSYEYIVQKQVFLHNIFVTGNPAFMRLLRRHFSGLSSKLS